MTKTDSIEQLHAAHWSHTTARAAAELAHRHQCDAVRQAHDAGLKLREIAAELGMSVSRAHQLLHEENDR